MSVSIFGDGRTFGLQGFRFVGSRYYTSSGVFEKADAFGDASGVVPRAIRVTCIGGGAAGGGSEAAGAGESSVGSGGGGGGVAWSFITDISSLDSTVVVTVGAGGTGVSDANGNNGQESSFGSLVRAGGGSGGIRGIKRSTFPFFATRGGFGGGAPAGDVQIEGAIGDYNVYIAAASGIRARGGGNVFSPGSRNAFANITANEPGRPVGGGGGGSVTPQNAVAGAGGNGASGQVWVEVYV